MVDVATERALEGHIEADQRLPPKKEVKSARSTAHIGKEGVGARKRR